MHRSRSNDTSDIPLINANTTFDKGSAYATTATDNAVHTHRNEGSFSGLRACLICAALVLAINLTFTIAVVATHGTGSEGRIALFEGDCQQSPGLDAGIHVLINILGTALLASCNYCMQCLAAPTRRDVNKVHRQGGWLDIGVQSIRNLRHVGKANLIVWVLLALTSLPLHLFYNAVIFSSSATNDYDIYTVNDGFTLPSAKVSANDSDTIDYFNEYKGLTRLRQKAFNGTLQRLNATDCIKAYAQTLVTTRSGLLLVVSNGSSATQATVFHADRSSNEISDCDISNERYPWICNQDGFVYEHDGIYGSQCNAPGYTTCQSRLEGIISNTTGWRPYNDLRVDYCLSEQVAPHCKLQTSFEILIIVLVINILKMAGIWWAYHSRRVKYDRLRTTGDAVASFLDEHDPHTKSMSLLSAADVFKGKILGYETVSKPFINNRPRLFSAVNRHRWMACIAVYTLGIAVMIGLLIHGLQYISTLPYVQGSAFSFGLDSLDPRFLITWSVPTSGTEGLLSNILVANIPQVIVSMIYFTYNDLGTRMAAAWEWSTYAIARKGLRVSTKPQGQQRSSYFLTLPYRFAIPLMVCCGLLHWLVSQSIYPVVTEHYSFMKYGNQSYEWTSPQYYSQPNEMTCAWSPLGVVSTIAVATFLVAAILFVSNFRLASPMPVVGSNSLAIAAACQVEQKTDYRMSQQRVQWGVISSEIDNSAHCGFADSIEGMPMPGIEYT